MKKYFYLASIAILLGLGFYIYKLTTYTYITVKFSELRPFHHRIPVYYKGIVVGKALDRNHTDDYKYTLVNVVLYPKNLMLPDNTKVLLKKEKRNNEKERDFLELIYPKEPSDKMIADGTELKGKATVDVDSFMANQDPDDLQQIKENLASASENLDDATGQLTELLVLIQDVIKENQVSIKSLSKNLAITTGNLNQITSKFDRSIKQKSLDNTMTSIDESVKNVQTLTSSLNGTTQSINTAMPRIDTTLYETQSLVSNANAITCGIRQTLSKRFGGLRILFGKTVKECECNPCRR